MHPSARHRALCRTALSLECLQHHRLREIECKDLYGGSFCPIWPCTSRCHIRCDAKWLIQYAACFERQRYHYFSEHPLKRHIVRRFVRLRCLESSFRCVDVKWRTVQRRASKNWLSSIRPVTTRSTFPQRLDKEIDSKSLNAFLKLMNRDLVVHH